MNSVEAGLVDSEEMRLSVLDLWAQLAGRISALSASELERYLTLLDEKPRPNERDPGHLAVVLVEQYKMMIREKLAQVKQQGPSSPLEGIDLIHRGNDGYACFARKDADGFRQLFNVRMNEFKGWIPQLIEHVLGNDCYFSLNSMFVGAPYPSKLIPQLPGGARKSSLLRHITACWIDCDVRGVDQDEQLCLALSTRMKARERGIEIPEWSMMIHSGQGFWLLWLLKEQDNTPGTGKPIRTNRSGKLEAAWNRCQTQLLRAFEPLKADASAIDLARVARVPGSINSKSGNKVAFRVNYGDDGGMVAYSLNELCAMLNVEQPKTRRITNVDPIKSEQARAKRKSMLEKRLQRWKQLAEMRGGYKVGTRSSALWVAAATLRQLRVDKPEALDALEELNQAWCDPPLKGHEVKAAYTGAKSARQVSDKTIGDRLKVSEQESRATGWPYLGFTPDPSLKGNSRARVENRRELLRMNVREAGGEVLTARDHADRLAKQGVIASPRTIQLDLKALGLEPPAQ